MDNLIQIGNPGYNKQQRQLRLQQPPVTNTANNQIANNQITSDQIARPVEQGSASQRAGIIGYGAGGGAIYDPNKTPSNIMPANISASTTTISNYNKNNQVSGINTSFDKITNDRGLYSDGETQRKADGSIYQSASVDKEAKDEYDRIYAPMLDQMRASLDTQTAQQIEAIQRQIEQRRQEVNEYSRNQSEATERARIMTGQAQSSQQSVSSLLSSQEKYRMKQINELDQKEMDLISSAKQAQETGNYKLLAQQIEIIQGIRTQKIAEAKEVNKLVAERNKELFKEREQANKNTAVLDIYQSGVTRPIDIFNKLKATGDYTLEDINKIVENTVPKPIQELARIMYQNGASSEEVSKVLSSNSTQEAYTKAGRWGVKPKEGKEDISKEDISFETQKAIMQAISTIPVQLRNTEKEMDRYEGYILDALDNGYSPVEARNLALGWNSPQTTFSDNILQKLMTSGDPKIRNIFPDVSNLINSNNLTGAVKATEGNIMQSYGKNINNQYMREETAITADRRAMEIKKYIAILSKEKQPVGAIKLDQWLGRFKSKEAQKIATEVQQMVSKMRNDLAGTALTAYEVKALDPLVPELGNTFENFMIKLNQLQTEPLREYNDARQVTGLDRLTRQQLLDMNERVRLYGEENVSDRSVSNSSSSSSRGGIVNTTIGKVNTNW